MSELTGVPPPDSSPEKALPSPLPSIPPRPHFPSPNSLRAWLPLYLKKTDATVSHLHRVFSTPSGTDSFLLTIQYSTLATSTLLSELSLRHLHISILRLISLARSLPKDTTIIIDPSALPAPRLLRLAQSLKALSALISDFRIFVRLWGLLGIWKWGKGLLEQPPADRTLRGIAWAEVGVNVAYQVLENAAYLASKGVLGWDQKRQSKAWLWSSRFWAAHVGLEFLRLGYLKRKMGAPERKNTEGVNKKEEERLWMKDLVSNMAYAPLTLHWSKETGLIGDFWVGMLGTAAGAAGFSELWKNTA